MTRKLIVLILAIFGAVAPLRADLTCTSRTEFTPAPSAADANAAPVNPMLAMIGSQLVRQLLPGGPSETTTYISEKGTRTEYLKGGTAQYREGTTTLLLNDGSFIVLNPADKTYWKTTLQAITAGAPAAGIEPHVASMTTSDVETIAGVAARRTTFEISIDLPIPEPIRSQLPAGFPSAITMSGEVWTATAPFEKYVPIFSKNLQAVGGPLGLGKVLTGGIPMRLLIRSALFADQQLEMHVTSIAEQTLAASLFEVPADYKEVPGPIR
jgi:hypothetical protein